VKDGLVGDRRKKEGTKHCTQEQAGGIRCGCQRQARRGS